MVTEFGMSDASGNGQISTINTGKWLKRLDQTNVISGTVPDREETFTL